MLAHIFFSVINFLPHFRYAEQPLRETPSLPAPECAANTHSQLSFGILLEFIFSSKIRVKYRQCGIVSGLEHKKKEKKNKSMS